MSLKPGSRLRSQVCATEVVVIHLPGTPVDLRCGGEPMVSIDVQPTELATPVAGFDGGSLLGKRYTAVEIDGLEVLVTKAGSGSLSNGDAVLVVKQAKQLPSSD
jgi:hypothetical protein